MWHWHDTSSGHPVSGSQNIELPSSQNIDLPSSQNIELPSELTEPADNRIILRSAAKYVVTSAETCDPLCRCAGTSTYTLLVILFFNPFQLNHIFFYGYLKMIQIICFCFTEGSLNPGGIMCRLFVLLWLWEALLPIYIGHYSGTGHSASSFGQKDILLWYK